MDFTKLDVGVSAPAKQETAFEVDLPDFKNGNGKPLSVTVLSFASPEGRKELKKWQIRYADLAKDHSSAGEKDLEALVDKAIEGDVEMIARVIKAWNIEESGGKAVPCTLENRKAFLSAFPPVADAIAIKVVGLAEELGNSKPA